MQLDSGGGDVSWVGRLDSAAGYPWTSVLDSLTQTHVRNSRGRIVNVNCRPGGGDGSQCIDGQREILGLPTWAPARTAPFWLALPALADRSGAQRGGAGCTSDAHQGLKNAMRRGVRRC